MGLALEVGILADLKTNDLEGYKVYQDQFSELSKYLKKIKFPNHIEPEDCEVWGCDMYGYRGIHYLRRLAVYIDMDNDLPEPGDQNSSKDKHLFQYYREYDKLRLLSTWLLRKFSKFKFGFDHLIIHSDCNGFYLPIKFNDVLIPDMNSKIIGRFVGSSYKLLDECTMIANILGIPPEFNEISEELYIASDDQGHGDELWEIFGVEAFTCVRLIRACEMSIKNKAAITFT